MDSAELEEKIVKRLENGEDRDDILLDLCENMEIRWPEAEALLNRIQSGNKNKITLAQSPLLIPIALATFIGGVGLIGISVYDMVVTFGSYSNANTGTNVSDFGIGYLLYLFTYGGWFWGLTVLGLGMVLGSLKGMEDVWAAIFERLGIFQGNE